MRLNLLRDKKFYLILIWLVFTTILAAWWMVVGLSHVAMLEKLVPEQSAHWSAQKRMLFWEGMAWIALLIIGGVTSLYFMVREKSHLENLKTFFASFNHDVKTSLASLRLQAEALREDFEEQGTSPKVLDRLISDTVRLQVQLENSLYMSTRESHRLLLERKSLDKLINMARLQWPQVKIQLNRNAWLNVDERAFVTVMNNLIQNAIVHGGADEITFTVSSKETDRVEIAFQDNGRGFSGSVQKLGSRLFYRPTSKSGTGMGLYICNELLKRMNGHLRISENQTQGFSGAFDLKGELS